ncbi:S41A1 protein, partial [Acrocephalus arundinaceus]|nr:S41A1 protein [Acrocephalus arundinaceus]
MTSKLEQKETPQANGAVVPGDCLASPEPSEFLGPDGTGVEVVVLESRANAKGVREEDALLENGSQSNESDDTSTDRGPEPASPLKETSFSIGLQVLFPFLLAGFGTVAAGMVLDIVQEGHWLRGEGAAEASVWELRALCASQLERNPFPAAAGDIPAPGTAPLVPVPPRVLAVLFQARASQVNVSLSVCQTLWLIPELPAALPCALEASRDDRANSMIMIGVIIGSRKMGINPDNVATPIAASLGDLITLALLSGISWGLYKELESKAYVNPLVCAFFISLLPIWVIIAKRNSATREVLYSGWEPVIIAMAISSVGGLILDRTVSDPNFAGMAVFTPVINGVGGNLVAVQASRISTYLHMSGVPGDSPGTAPRKCPSPCSTFFSSDVNSRSARVLFLLVVPGHLVFLYTIHSMQGGHTTLTLIFIVFYMTAALLQVLILLYIADWMVHWMWGRHLDPDNFSIPYLTALGDLIGTGLLALSFHVLWLIGDRDSDVGD